MSYFGTSYGSSGGESRGQREFVARENEANSFSNTVNGADNVAEEEEEAGEEEEEEDSFGCDVADRIKRSYHLPATSQQYQQAATSETIQVTLNESYFANERRLFVNSVANVRQKLHSLQLFNPAKNESIRQQAEEAWNEKEKYTLDSLNELKGQLDERFQWNRPEDGREVWPSKLQYFLAITSYSIGLGNVIRFPILVQKNGGLAFIIPFVIMLLLEGIPLFYLELAIGQRMRKAAISCWNLVSPFAAGIGLASAAVSFLIGLYYNTMVAWTLIYTWAATTNRLPPRECPGTSERQDDNIVSGRQQQQQLDSNGSSTPSLDECQLSGPFEYYWYRQTLDVTGDVSDWSHFNWSIAFCLVLAWLISYICLVKGLSSSKRLVYIISIFPYVILIIFLFRAVNLRGMNHGLRYLFEPDWSKLFDPFVWLQAAAQVFFSLGLGFGGLIALSSYNSINNNCYKDAIKVSLINFFTSILAGVVIFSILGFKATINYDKCQLEREQQIDFYLADYNLKVLDYGAVFKQVPMPAPTSKGGKLRLRRSTPATAATKSRPPNESQLEGDAKKSTDSEGKKKPTKKKKVSKKTKKKTADTEVRSENKSNVVVTAASVSRDNIRKSPVTEFIAERNDTYAQLKNGTSSRSNGTSPSVAQQQIATTQAVGNKTADRKLINDTSRGNSNGNSDQDNEDDDDDDDEEFSAEDAIASINNLDRQLDMGSPSGTFDYGDSDTEFILNASHLIDRRELDQIIDNINNLQQCSIERELDASTQGTALVFVAIAEAISQFDTVADPNAPRPQSKRSFIHLSSSTWTILFFLMILALGLDSQFGNLEGLLSSLTDLNFFNLNLNYNNNDHLHQATTTAAAGLTATGRPGADPVAPTIVAVRKYATGAICCLSLAISVVLFAHGAGSYMFAIFDEYAANFSLILIALFELLAISYIYGLKRFCDDCELMTGKRPPFIVLLSWRYISPILLLIIVFTTIKQFTVELNYDVWSLAGGAGAATVVAAGDSHSESMDTVVHVVSKTWPNWSILFGALLIICCVIWIPLIAILRIMRITVIPEEKQRCWFPVEELKEFHQLQDQEHQVTKLERILFGFNQDDD